MTLLRFDLGFLPARAVASSAAVTANVRQSTSAATLQAHLITAPWIESSVTWNTFAGAFDSTLATSFANQGPTYTGPLSFDVTSIVSGWVNGAAPNDGILLEQAGTAFTNFWSSESGVATSPKLDLCYTISG